VCQGYIIVKGALSSEEVAACNASIDRRRNEFYERPSHISNAKQNSFSGGSSQASGRLEHGHFLQWPKEDASPFRNILAHPNLVPSLNNYVGEGFRLDHRPLLFIQEKGVEGFDLHGGAIAASGAWNQELAYHYDVRSQK